jgi:phage/plasmid primase-like uncharacterized protein
MQMICACGCQVFYVFVDSDGTASAMCWRCFRQDGMKFVQKTQGEVADGQLRGEPAGMLDREILNRYDTEAGKHGGP